MSRTLFALGSVLLLTSACIGEPQVATVTLNQSAVTLDAIGATATLSASAADQDGNPLTVDVSWSSSATGVATVSPAGVVTAVANGSATVTATAGGVSSNATVTVAQAVTAVTKTAGDAQTGAAGLPLGAALTVALRDRLNQPVAGAAVAFAVMGGGGAVSAASVTSSTAGEASTNWTLGTVAGDAQTVSAAAGGVSATFSATAIAGAPDSLIKVSGDNQNATPSSTLPDSLVVRVADAFGNDVEGAVVSWAVTSGGGGVSPVIDTTDASGLAATAWTTGASLGTQTAEATQAAVAVGSPAQFTASVASGTIAVGGGDGQTGLVDYATNVRPYVLVTAGGNPVPGVTVTFAVTGGGGSVTGGSQVTDANGIAQVGSWTLGASAGANELTATAAGTFNNNPVTFTATGATQQYNIELRYLTTPTTAQQQAFDSAAARWTRIIYGDLTDIPLNVAAGTCGSNSPAINETIDDLVIFVTLEPIDGPSGILGSAGPCFIRTTGQLTIVGRMRFDTDDLANLEADGRLGDVILHEMGHVLGIGPLWDNLGFLKNPSLPSSPGADTHFDGPAAIAAMDSLGGTSYTGGAKVPVENNAAYGEGTRDAHWREDVFDHELMTGIVEAAGTANNLSVMTIASLLDLGYQVNYAEKDTYVRAFSAPPAGAAGAGGGQLILKDDVIFERVHVVDDRGRVLRVINP